MAIPVRINEDNYISLRDEAEKNRRSVIGQLNHILDQHFGRSTLIDTLEQKVDETSGLVRGLINTPLSRPDVGNCKIHGTPLDNRGRCLQKGCKYA